MLIQGQDGELRIYDRGMQNTDFITNGTFASDSGWTKETGWTIANGVATCSGPAGSGTSIVQALTTLMPNRTYKVTFTISAVTAAGGGIAPVVAGVAGTTRTTAATFTERVTISSTTNHIGFRADTAFNGNIDNIFLYRLGSGCTHYMEVLFCNMDFSGPTARPRTEERLIMNRGKYTTDAHYIEGPDEPRFAPVPISFSCKVAGTTDSLSLRDWLSGVTEVPNAVGGTTEVYSYDGSTSIDGKTLKDFAGQGKNTYRTEIIWAANTTSGVSYGLRYEEVYFAPDQQTITEAEGEFDLTCNGLVYGDVTRIRDFTSGTSIVQFT